MTKYLHDQSGQERHSGYNDILDTDLERREFDKNFGDSEVYNSIIDEEPAFHSSMNFPEDDEVMYSGEEDNIFEDRDSYKDADKDDIYYFI